jgi:hypothetical protein
MSRTTADRLSYNYSENKKGGRSFMRRYPSRQESPLGGIPAPVTPTTPVAPITPAVPAYPTGVAPTAAAAFPTGAPAQVAPVRRVVHPTNYMERHTVTRYPVLNVYPSHVHNVHHNVQEQHCAYPHSVSNQCCNHVVNHCCPPPRRRPC